MLLFPCLGCEGGNTAWSINNTGVAVFICYSKYKDLLGGTNNDWWVNSHLVKPPSVCKL